MKAATRRLIDLMRSPADAGRLSLAEWAELLSVARAANVVGTLGERLSHADGASLPHQVKRHLVGMAQLSERQRESVRWEAHQLARALQHLAIPVLLLKGSAYVLGGLPVSVGRLFGDIDILVPRASLGDVEIAMMTHGWTSAKQSAYDQRYYRQWMHELPPMVNVRRGTVLDIHHTLLPLTSRYTPDPKKLIDTSCEIPGLGPLRIPSPQDLLIHSITHLFHEGELRNGMRDLFDIDGLIRHFADTVPGFWKSLANRAEDLQLARPLFLGLHFAARLLGTPVPEAMLRGSGKQGAPAPTTLRILEVLFDRGLQPIHADCDSTLTPIARWLLYVRAHWLRMPPHLLTMHLSRKAWKNLFPGDERSTTEAENGLPQ